jgi:L-threonylcarbamoyladenylate synthase
MDTLPFRSVDDVEQAIPRVLDHLRAGGVMAYPTETVYGFGCALRPQALAQLRALKRRVETKPFLLLVARREDAPGLQWTPVAQRLADAFWPGPLTLALEAARDAFPAEVRSVDGTVAVRATSHPGVRRLLERLGAPITSTSANVPGGQAALDAAGARRAVEWLGGREVLVLDGGTLPPTPSSTVIDASRVPPRLLRPGAVPLAALRNAIGEVDEG